MGLFRALLAVTVVFAHSPWNDGAVFVGGPNAVQLFYMISGFLIHHVLARNEAYAKPLTFYKSRLLRILPIYYVVAVLAVVTAPLLVPSRYAVYRAAPLSAQLVLVLSNLLVLGQDWVMFLGIYDGQLALTTDFKTSELMLYQGLFIPQAWTLGIELSFYALAPFVLKKRSWMVALLVCSLMLRAALIAAGMGLNDPWSYRFFPTELALFMVGALANDLLLPRYQRRLSEAAQRWLPKLTTAVVLAMTMSYFLVPGSELVKMVGLFTVALLALPLLFMAQNQSAFDRAVGELSYPIYIGHMLVEPAVRRVAHRLGDPGPLALSLTNVVGAVVFAVLLNRLIAIPMERYRARIKRAG